MIYRMALAVALLATGRGLLGQQPLDAHWVNVLPAQKVYATPDSIRIIGKDVYRVVTVNDPFPGMRVISTDEVRCSDGTSRTIRLRSVGRHVLPGKGDDAEPNSSFEKPYPGGPADVKYRNICAMARAKFGKR